MLVDENRVGLRRLQNYIVPRKRLKVRYWLGVVLSSASCGEVKATTSTQPPSSRQTKLKLEASGSPRSSESRWCKYVVETVKSSVNEV